VEVFGVSWAGWGGQGVVVKGWGPVMTRIMSRWRGVDGPLSLVILNYVYLASWAGVFRVSIGFLSMSWGLWKEPVDGGTRDCFLGFVFPVLVLLMILFYKYT